MTNNKNNKYSGISIVIPTYGKRNFLKDVLISLNNQIIKHFNVEVLVIYQDRDDIDEIIKSIEFDKIEVILIHNEKLGSTRARNTGTIKAKYSLIAYIDDDIIPLDRSWLKNIWSLYQNHNVAVLCGKIILDPLFPHDLKAYRDLFVDFDKGNKNKFLKLGSFVPSAQLIITKSLMLKLGGFRLNLDRVGTNLMSGCDNELSISLGKINQRVFYSPSLKVMHHILPFRKGFFYLFKRVFLQGVTDSYLENHFYKIGKRKIICSLASWLLFILKKSTHFISNPKENTNHFDSIIYKTGYIYGLFYALARPQPKPRPLNIYEQV